MHPSVDVQVWRLAVLFLMGILCSLTFQVYTALRAATSPAKLTGHVLDGLVAVVVLTAIAGAVLLINYGEVRLYIVIALAMGFLFANALVGNIVYGLAFTCARHTVNGIARAKRCLTSAMSSFNQKIRLLVTAILPKPPPENGDNRQ
ncbi:MAG: spore cortex biosynthesis protein YabQ [Bacillota bacterium]|jgi:hypothetical protein|nr:hypothetical protein [Candidatus Fermentithermobacillaceae bacterium]